MNLEQLNQARAQAWHQAGNALLTADDASAWLRETGLCLFVPRPQQLGTGAPSFVEATLGDANPTPTLAQIRSATELLHRLLASGDAVALNLLGTPGEQPDFLATPESLPFVFALRGDREWKRGPRGKSSPLQIEVWKLLTSKGPLTATEVKEELGRQLSESAALRALSELWSYLRVEPTFSSPDEPAQWQPLERAHEAEMVSGARLSQAAALSGVVSLYLQSSVAASEGEMESVLSPLASRSKVREVVHALLAGRQLGSVHVGPTEMFHLEGALEGFSETAGAEGVVMANDSEQAPDAERRPKRGEDAPARKPYGRRDEAGSAPAKRTARPAAAADRPSRPFRPRTEGAPRSDRGAAGERRPFRKSADGEERRPFRRSEEGGAPRRESPGAGEERRPFRRAEGAGEERRPFRRNDAEGAGGERRPFRPAATGERKPFRRDEAPGGERRPYARKPAEGGPALPFRKEGAGGPRRENASGSDRRPSSFGRKPFDSGERRPFRPRTEGGDGAPRRGESSERPERRPFTPRGESGFAAKRPASGERRGFEKRGSDRPGNRSGEGAAAKPFGRKSGPSSFRPRRAEGDERPRPDGERSKPFRSFGGGEDRPRPARPRPDSDRAFRPRAEGERPRPARPRPDGDRPFRPRADGDRARPTRPRPDGDRPFRPRTHGDRPRPARPRAEGGVDRPFRPRADGDPARPTRPRSDGDRPFRPRTDSNRPRPARPRAEGGVDRPRPARSFTEGDRPRPARPRAGGEGRTDRPRSPGAPGGSSRRPGGAPAKRSFKAGPGGAKGGFKARPKGGPKGPKKGPGQKGPRR